MTDINELKDANAMRAARLGQMVEELRAMIGDSESGGVIASLENTITFMEQARARMIGTDNRMIPANWERYVGVDWGHVSVSPVIHPTSIFDRVNMLDAPLDESDDGAARMGCRDAEQSNFIDRQRFADRQQLAKELEGFAGTQEERRAKQAEILGRYTVVDRDDTSVTVTTEPPQSETCPILVAAEAPPLPAHQSAPVDPPQKSPTKVVRQFWQSESSPKREG